MPLSECNSTVFNYAVSRGWTPFRNGIGQSSYCAADPNKERDTCKGDSGGPLQIIRRNLDLSTIVGVISTGLPCGSSWKFPGIYARVAFYIDWIESYVWPNGEIATPLINQAALYNWYTDTQNNYFHYTILPPISKSNKPMINNSSSPRNCLHSFHFYFLANLDWQTLELLTSSFFGLCQIVNFIVQPWWLSNATSNSIHIFWCVSKGQ